MSSSLYNELFSLEGKTVLITGGGKGLGAQISRVLARAGCKVFIVGRSRESGENLVKELSEHGFCHFLQHDLSSPVEIQALAEKLGQHTNSLDILVNNAGTFNAEPMGDVSVERWDELMALNLRSPFFLTQELLPLLKASASNEDPARIINIGSIGGVMPQSNGAYAYGCSKAAVHQMTRMLASDLRSQNINVNAIAPGYFPSDMTAGFFAATPGLEDTLVKQIPAGRLGNQQDIGGLVVYLSSLASAYITGTITTLDGGFLSAP